MDPGGVPVPIWTRVDVVLVAVRYIGPADGSYLASKSSACLGSLSTSGMHYSAIFGDFLEFEANKYN
jgi:hypothetical protein